MKVSLQPGDSALAMQVGQRIQRLRKEKSWTVAHEAYLVGLPEVVVTRIEEGKREMTLSQLERFARAFFLQPKDLL